MPSICFAQISDEEYMNVNLGSVKRDESVSNRQFLEIGFNWKSRGLEQIENDIKQMNPDLVESLRNEPDAIKASEYKSWLAKQTFEDFYNRYMQDLENYSKKLGRQIVKKDIKKDDVRYVVEYKLSTDDLTDCHIEPVFGEKLCYEPDGYIQYSIRYSESLKTGKKSLIIGKDVPEDNRSSSYQFDLDVKDSDLNGKHKTFYTLGYIAKDQEYSKVAKYRYYIVKDLLSGMCKITCKDCLFNGNIVTISECDTDSEKYMSNLVPGFIGINFVETYSNDTKK